MDTQNKRLKQEKDNKEYYGKSDGQFIPMQYCQYAHKVLARVAWLREWVHKLDSSSHLDIGCKDGYTCMTLASEGIPSFGIDPSEDAIKEAIARKNQLSIDEADFAVSFAEDIDDKHRFHTVSCMEVIEHVLDEKVLMQKLSKLGDYVFITTPDRDGVNGTKDAEQNEEHVRLFDLEELTKLASQYGEVIEAKKEGHELYILFKTVEKNN